MRIQAEKGSQKSASIIERLNQNAEAWMKLATAAKKQADRCKERATLLSRESSLPHPLEHTAATLEDLVLEEEPVMKIADYNQVSGTMFQYVTVKAELFALRRTFLYVYVQMICEFFRDSLLCLLPRRG